MGDDLDHGGPHAMGTGDTAIVLHDRCGRQRNGLLSKDAPAGAAWTSPGKYNPPSGLGGVSVAVLIDADARREVTNIGPRRQRTAQGNALLHVLVWPSVADRSRQVLPEQIEQAGIGDALLPLAAYRAAISARQPTADKIAPLAP